MREWRVEDESAPGTGSTIVDLVSAAPLGRFAATAPRGQLRFVPGTAEPGVDVVAVADASASPLIADGHSFLAFTVRCVADLAALAGAVARTLDHVRVHEALRLRADRDSPTMVGSRGAFDDALMALDLSGEGVAIVLADIDWFKQVNDRLGHLTGDEVLVDTAQAMLECLRQHDQLFRVGGDEFAIIVPDVDQRAAEGLSRRLVDHTGSLLGEVQAGLSVGVAARVEDERMEQCMVRADRCLYEAKADRPIGVR